MFRQNQLIVIAIALALFGIPGCPPTPVKTCPEPTSGQAGPTITIFDDTNVSGVQNGGTSPCFKITSPMVVTYMTTYHWNGGVGAPAGTITLLGSTGIAFGPFPTTNVAGQGGVPANWEVRPSAAIPADTYTIVDSDPRTWSTNAQAANLGFARVEGTTTTSGTGLALSALVPETCTTGYCVNVCSGAVSTTFTPVGGQSVTITATIAPSTSRPGVTLIDGDGNFLLNTQGVDNDNSSISTIFIQTGTKFPLRLVVSDCSATASNSSQFSVSVTQP